MDSKTNAELEYSIFERTKSLRVSRAYVFLKDGALATIVRVRNAWSAADDASSLVGTVVALVAYSHQRGGTHVRVADDAFSVGFLAQSPDSFEKINATRVNLLNNSQHVINLTYQRPAAFGKRSNLDDAWPFVALETR